MDITFDPNSSTIRNVILAFVSSLTYSITIAGTGNNKIARDSITFGITNALSQQFIPDIVDNENLQSLFIDPVVASIVQGIIKIFIYGDSDKTEKIILKSLVAGISASALTLHIHDGIKKY